MLDMAGAAPRDGSQQRRPDSLGLTMSGRGLIPRARPQPRQGDRAEDRASGRDGAHEDPAGKW
jgi:hypothetical protein